MIKATLGDPNHGWVVLSLQAPSAEVEIVGSYAPGDSFLELIRALDDMLHEGGERTVTWYEEPQETDLCFVGRANRVQLTVRRFRDHRRTKGGGRVLLDVAGSFEQVCLPLWRALRSLQGRFSQQDLDARWHKNFLPMTWRN
jgi:hypothetical protein